MPVELEMPELAESVTEGEIVKWLVKEGEHVNRDQPLVEIMTDKVTVEVPSPYEGILLKQVAAEGAVVPIGKPIAVFGKEGETLEGKVEESKAPVEVKAEAPAAEPTAPVAPAEAAPPKQEKEEKVAARPDGAPPHAVQYDGHAAVAPPQEQATLSKYGRPMAAPAVRKLARKLGIDLFGVRGSGEAGRIRREDVERVAGARKAAPAAAPAAAAKVTPPPTPAVPYAGEAERVPLRGMRRIIADHMVHSKHTAAHTLHVDEVDLTELVTMRDRAKEKAAEHGIKLTYLPFFVKAACFALKKFPYVNASLDDATHEIILKKEYNIGIAVNTDAGLVVPVVHRADAKSIFELARAIAELAEKARSGKLSHHEISNGTFTITNVGSIGGLFTFPVINYPEVAILGTHSIAARPVVRDRQVVVRQMMYLSLSFDHRVVDGAMAALFVKEVAELLSHPDVLLMEAG